MPILVGDKGERRGEAQDTLTPFHFKADRFRQVGEAGGVNCIRIFVKWYKQNAVSAIALTNVPHSVEIRYIRLHVTY
ncbi:MAG: hypothetical protein PUP91_24765 [Rhizonema sp. PD37]|nr:hypothetical protein [Rhizonema sp. PD37]